MNTVTTMNTAVKTASVSLVVDNTKPLTMSTLQIAELTGKKHKHVMRDVRQMIESLELGSKLVESNSGLYYFVEKEYKAENGKSNPFYELDEDLCNTLVMGYDAPLRFKIAKEWRLMKEGKANVPVNPYEHFEETDWIELALKKTRENKQLIELHVRKSVDSHSMTRLLGAKKGATKVKEALTALRTAGYIERVYDENNKPCGYVANDSSLSFCRMNAHYQLEFTVDVLPVLVELGVLEEEQKATLNLPKPNNTILIQNKAAERLRQNVGSLEVFGL
ncbi:Rha family transcriptional regulator [Escherichia coli]|uniref:Rha family transcriptional regulator n=1 Tax=Escherichia coli TaxID=562 RepID=UPI001CA46D06|nr:Rha family transcriptional regulator [Escherichia coli]MBY8774303.1 Rha family transcriptional regulator [Escherichia coli]MDT8471132.1 Rha family transcriptional regulator [Escherichia coli]MDT8484939.1 Rha family transcriptional regulator [Escherichia coli]MDT8583129.1 Rha family transcriptional regulator [Escherichia coli]MDT8610435.1 Rha family transcriptional regulator [Escherichia coli]